jgi:hypothetical protein
VFVPFVAAAGEGETKLVPPHGEIPPSFWELHAWQIILGAVALVALVLLCLVWLWRPRPVVIIPPGSRTRLDLEALHGLPEDGPLLVRVSRILRRHIAIAFDLPPDELTTGEFARALQSSGKATPEIADAIVQFLRQCDERKFSASPPASQKSVIDAALELFEKVEQSRAPAPPIIAAAPSVPATTA